MKTVYASQAKIGQWIVHNNPTQNQRIVDVSTKRDGSIAIYTDFGNGGEPATNFFESDEKIQVI